MNGYVEAGYVVGLGGLGCYAASIVGRARAARRRLGAGHAAEGGAELALDTTDVADGEHS